LKPAKKRGITQKSRYAEANHEKTGFQQSHDLLKAPLHAVTIVEDFFTRLKYPPDAGINRGVIGAMRLIDPEKCDTGDNGW
jgi:hypothetical protein